MGSDGVDNRPDKAKFLESFCKHYPSCVIFDYLDDNGEIRDGAFGDTLAEFVVSEIHDSFTDEDDPAKRFELAITRLKKARQDLSFVITGALKERII